MKKIYKIIFILIIIFNLVTILNNVKAGDIWNTSKKFMETGANSEGMLDDDAGIYTEIKTRTTMGFGKLIDFIWGIGLLVIFISTVILGIKYMLVIPEEKSKIKQATTPYIIGVVIIFGALTIWKFIIQVFDGSL